MFVVALSFFFLMIRRTPRSQPLYSSAASDGSKRQFNRSAPIIKLRPDATEDDHFALLGLLNSSTACFWMKQTLHDKGGGGIGCGLAPEAWEPFYEFTGTGLQKFPVPAGTTAQSAAALAHLAQRYGEYLPDSAVSPLTTPSAQQLNASQAEASKIRRQMIALQEELDWQCYSLYGLADDDLQYHAADLPGIDLGQLAFGIVMASQMAAGELESPWFYRHGSAPITKNPAACAPAYHALADRRYSSIQHKACIRLNADTP